MTTKTETVEKTVALAASTADIALVTKVEELADLKGEVDRLRKVEKKYNSLRDELKELVPEDHPADEPYEVMGLRHKVTFAANSKLRTVTDPKFVHEMLGSDTFYGIVKINVTDLDKYLTKYEMDAVVETTIGPVRVCSVKKIEE